MGLLIIDGNCIYEVDEECMKKRDVPATCEILEKYRKEKEKQQEKRSR